MYTIDVSCAYRRVIIGCVLRRHIHFYYDCLLVHGYLNVYAVVDAVATERMLFAAIASAILLYAQFSQAQTG